MTARLASNASGRPRPPLTSAAIVSAARRLIERRGVDACSMRTLVGALGIQAPALYRRIGSKDELLALVLDDVMGDMALPDDGEWQEQLAEIMRRLRALFARRAALAALHAYSTPHGPNAVRFIEAAAAALLRAGFSQASATFAITALTTYTIGFTFLSASRSRGTAHRQARESLRRSREAAARRRGGGPLGAYALLEGTHYADAEPLFEFGLRHMIAGLDADLPRVKTAPPIRQTTATKLTASRRR
ncbi:MAG: TetR/AcrR family transcriptional regulator [bacterium]